MHGSSYQIAVIARREWQQYERLRANRFAQILRTAVSPATNSGAMLTCTVGPSLAACGLACTCGAGFSPHGAVNAPIGAIQPGQASAREDVLGGEL
jgi:hypothetical protein